MPRSRRQDRSPGSAPTHSEPWPAEMASPRAPLNRHYKEGIFINYYFRFFTSSILSNGGVHPLQMDGSFWMACVRTSQALRGLSVEISEQYDGSCNFHAKLYKQ